MKIIDAAFRIGNTALKLAKHHSPTIMLVGGSLAVVAGGILACKQTLRASEIIDIHNSQLDKIDEATENYDEYTNEDRTKDLISVYCGSAGRFIRLYGPSLILEAAGFAAIFAGFGIIKKRYGLALSAVATLDDRLGKLSKSFVKYRNKVVDEYGEDVDAKFMKEEKVVGEIETTTQDEDGNEIVQKKKAISFDITNNDFVRVFDAYNDKWQGNNILDEALMTRIEQWYSKQLTARRIDHVFMNHIDHELGFEKTGIGHFYGWTSKPGCAISFNPIPCFKEFGSDSDDQFPMYIPVESEADYDLFVEMMNEDTQHNINAHSAADIQSRVCYLIQYNVDCDENGSPHEIYNEVYNK